MEHCTIFIPFCAYCLDLILGEPKTMFHPVCWLGNTASFLENKKLLTLKTDKQKFLYGLFCACILVLIFTIIPTLFLLTIKQYLYPISNTANTLFSFFYVTLILYLCIAPKSLIQHVESIKKELEHNNIIAARKKLSMIVGRNTQKMDDSDIIRASIESLSENSVDSTIASYFWFCLGYALGSFEGSVFFITLHRIFNTLDAMWGKKNEKYYYFGKVVAKTDDILNYLPARINFYCILLCSKLIKGCDTNNAYFIGKKYRNKHASPNSAWAEAPYAGALNLKLGGPVYYGNFFCDYPYLGEGTLNAQISHLNKAILLFDYTIFCTIILTSLITVFLI